MWAVMRWIAILLFASACNSGPEHVNAYTLEVCTPNQTYKPKPKKHTNDKCQGTSNGDNCDDLSSGKVDCIGDGNSGQGDDKKHNCMFPQPGCDENGCCDEDMVDDGGGEPDGGGDTGGGDTGGDTGDTGGDTGDGGDTGGGDVGAGDDGGGGGGGGGIDGDNVGGGDGGGVTPVPQDPPVLL